MKKIFIFLLTFVLLLTFLPLHAEAETVTAQDNYGLNWNVVLDESKHTCTVVAPFHWNYKDGSCLEIPQILTHEGINYTVTGIDGYFLKDASPYIYPGFAANTVVIPSTIQSISSDFISNVDNDSWNITEPIYVLNYADESALTPAHISGSSTVAIQQYSGQNLVSYKGWLAKEGTGNQSNFLYWIVDIASHTLELRTKSANSNVNLPALSNNSSLRDVLSSIDVTTLYLDENITSLDNLYLLKDYFTKVTTVAYGGTDQQAYTASHVIPSTTFPALTSWFNCKKVIVRFSIDDDNFFDIVVPKDKLLSKPSDPQRDGFDFGGWFLDKDLYGEKQWDFETDTPSGLGSIYFNDQFGFELKAAWTPIPLFDITTGTADNGTFGVVGSVTGIREGTTIELTYTAEAGYELDKWDVRDSSDNPITVTNNIFIMPGSNVTVSASFKLKTFYITVTPNLPNCTVDWEPKSGTMGTTVNLSASTTDTRKQFSNWKVSKGGITISDKENASTSFVIGTEDIEINAIFAPKQSHQINIKINPEKTGTVELDIYNSSPIEGDKITLDVHPNTGYKLSALLVFNHDTNEEITLQHNEFIMPDADVDVYAVFIELTPHYVIWLDSNGDELERRLYFPESGDKTPAATSNTKTPTKAMDDTYIYTFRAWNSPVYQGNDIIYSPIFDQVKRRTFLVIWMNDDGSELDSKTFLEGNPEPITDKIPTKISVMGDYAYKFKEWGTRTENKEKGTITYFPVFSDETIPLYGILVLNDGSGTASADVKTAAEGTTVTLTATPLTGYKFKAWEVVTGNVVVTDNQFIMGTENVRIRANFEKLEIVFVSFDADGGTGSMSQEKMYVGSEYTLPNCSYTAPQGKEFSCWEIGGKTYLPGETISVNADITAKAFWKDKSSSSVSYTVTFMIDSEYSIAVQTVFKGNKANKPSDPVKDGYVFVGWYTDSSLSTPFNFDTTIETNWTLYAKWTPKAAETDETIEYTIVNGAAQKWTKGSTNSVEIGAKRNLDDSTTLTHFVSLQIDGKSLVKDLDYTVRSGSVIATINPSALQNLGTGIHRITFVFDDGKAETTLTVEQSSDSSGSGGSGGGSSSGGSSSVPSTGDIFSNPFLWFGGMAIVIFFLKLFIDSRKKRLAEAEAMQNNKY